MKLGPHAKSLSEMGQKTEAEQGAQLEEFYRQYPHMRPDAKETKAVDADELPAKLPAKLPDPYGMSFTDEELDALTDTDNEETVKLAMGTSTPAKRALESAKQVKRKEKGND